MGPARPSGGYDAAAAAYAAYGDATADIPLPPPPIAPQVLARLLRDLKFDNGTAESVQLAEAT